MRFYFASLVLAASVTSAVARPQVDPATASGVAGFSTCLKTVVSTVFQTAGCLLLNYDCLCSQPGFIDRYHSTVEGQCGKTDADTADAFARSQCAARGYNLAAAPPSSSLAADQTPAALASDGTTTSSNTPPTTPPAAAADTPSAAPTMPYPMVNSTGNSTWNGNLTAPAPFTGSADTTKMGGIAAGLLGVAIAFAML